MPYYIRMNGSSMKVLIEQNGEIIHQKECPVGEQLLDFVYYDLKKINEFLDHIYTLVVHTRDRNVDTQLKKMDEKNIYLRFFAEQLADVLMHSNINVKESFEIFCARYPQEVALLKQNEYFSKVTYKTAGKAFLIGVFSSHVFGIQQFLREQLEFCMNSTGDKTYNDLTPSQRLYVYEQWRKAQGEQPLYFDSDSFSSRLVMDKVVDIPDNLSIQEIAARVRKANPNITEMAMLENGYALMRYELMKMVILGVPIKICAHCRRYFIPEGRIDAEYCSRPLADQPEKTCQSVGAMLKHQDKVKGDPIYQEYTKAYKRLNSRVRTRNMTQADFLAWSDEAREKRDQCLAGKLEQKEFFEWLNQDRKYKKADS